MSTDFFPPTQLPMRDPVPNVRLQGLSAEEPMHAWHSTNHPSAVRPGGAGSYGGQNLRRSGLDGYPPMMAGQSRWPEDAGCLARAAMSDLMRAAPSLV